MDGVRVGVGLLCVYRIVDLAKEYANILYCCRTLDTMTDTSNVVGYSSNDFFYTNTDYCSKIGTDYQKYKDDDSNEFTTDQTETPYKSGIVMVSNACSANEHYAKQIGELSKQKHTTSAKYNHSLIVYNRELLKTVNYLAGIGALVVYMYFSVGSK